MDLIEERDPFTGEIDKVKLLYFFDNFERSD